MKMFALAGVLAAALAWVLATILPWPAVQSAAAPAPRAALVYAAQCAICHGDDGNGKGMAAHRLVAQPRDFRSGQFKFRSTPSGALPTDEDLFRVISTGVRWTAMVGRTDLSEADRRAVVQHVKTFSPRFGAENSAPPMTVPPAPTANAQRIEVGRQLYVDAECAKCHGERADGKGEASPELVDDWGRPLPASDLTWRPLKRGSAPRDVYLTIATGLNGTPMPAYAAALEPRQIWALVFYLDSLVPGGHDLLAPQMLGEEQRGWMILRMHRGMRKTRH